MPAIFIRTMLPVLLSAVACFSQTIKLASLAPKGSPYDNGLRAIAADWEKISGGTIKMTIYSGGVAGDENDMLRKIKIGQLQAAGITAVGLCRVVKDIITVQLPMLVRTNAELYYVMEKMDSVFEKELERKGLKVLVWIPLGWARYFGRSPVGSPEQLKKMKMFIWAGDPHSVQAWKEMGFHPVPLAATDIMSSLQSGMVDALAAPPLSTAYYQWFTVANNMCELKWGPLIGGIVVSTTVWDKIAPELRPKLEISARMHGETIGKQILEADEQAVEAMKKNGLTVNPVSAEAQREWQKIADLGLSKIEGKSFRAEYRALVKRYVEEFRNCQ